MNILILSDDKWHPESVVKAGLTFLEAKNTITWARNINVDDKLINYKLVIISKANHNSSKDHDNWMTIKNENLVSNYVDNGGNLLVIHSGTAGYEDLEVYPELVGGIFKEHPQECLVTYKHKNKEPFTVLDEHYFMSMLSMNLDIFMTSESVHGIQPAGWSRYYGLGRVYVLTPGHNLEVWLNNINKEIIEEIIGGL